MLWIDELEKGFAGSKSSGSADGGTSARVFGSFLSWLQEKSAPVFIVATANDVSQLPPEMLRKGRFDELFFVDLPNAKEREAIWEIQIEKFGRDAAAFDLRQLAKSTDGFTGSEIELLLDAVRRATMELPVAGIDVVEVSPPYDHAEVTAYLANRVVLEALSGLAWRRRAASGANPRRAEDPLLEGRGDPG